MDDNKNILLSFDTEEFDLPRESGVDISLKDAMPVSVEGTNNILDILKEEGVKATFFCTTTFAQNAPKTMARIINEGHEVASHGCDHWKPCAEDVTNSKIILESLTGKEIKGYRQPRMFAVSDEDIEQQEYEYNSSLHPAFIPGRYMHLSQPRTPFYRGKVLEIPASVTPMMRVPVFWLACHNYPQWLYRKLCLWTLHHDGQFVIYFHPWEFINLAEHPEWKIPFIIKRNSGKSMCQRLKALIRTFKNEGAQFITYSEFTHIFQQKQKL